MMGWLCPDMRQVDGGGYHPRGRENLGINMGHLIVTSGDFVA